MRSLFLIVSAALMLLWSARAQDRQANTDPCLVGAHDLLDGSAPVFEQYAVKVSAPYTSAELDLQSNPIARTYRTVIREQMKEGPNFADHYRVATWGCGSSCAQFAVVNLTTGRVITADGIYNVSGVHFNADDFLPGTDDGGGFRFRKNSRLLVLVGGINEDDSKEGAFYYVLKNEKLNFVHKTIAQRNTCAEE